ncbi:MAG: biotin/lipoyl-containing protein [Acidobacteriota bacterium]
MRLLLEIDGEQMEVEYATDSQGSSLTVKGQRYEAEVTEPEPGFFVVLIGGRVYRCMLDQTPADGVEVTVNGRRLEVAVRDLKHLRGTRGAGAGSDGPATLKAPMPGKVVRVLCSVGDEVASGQGILIVEAMKMQNEVQSPRAGKVTALLTLEGQTVNAGEVLAVIE